jgi:hypothetical protein
MLTGTQGMESPDGPVMETMPKPATNMSLARFPR